VLQVTIKGQRYISLSKHPEQRNDSSTPPEPKDRPEAKKSGAHRAEERKIKCATQKGPHGERIQLFLKIEKRRNRKGISQSFSLKPREVRGRL